MAERRAVRSSSRHFTPTPQPLPAIAAATPQPTRGSRRRATKSASRDIAVPKPSPPRILRRSSRQASVASVAADQEHHGPQLRPAKEAVGDLSTVEEAESYMDLKAVPQSTPRRRPDKRYASPDQLSQISGTTAVTSFSMTEAEHLDADVIQVSIENLYRTSTKFLDFLLPDDGGIKNDHNRIQELRKPDSRVLKQFRALELNNNLALFKSEGEQYIHLRAVRRALHRDRDHNAPLLGVDLVVYLANLLIFVKQMITSERSSERGSRQLFDALCQLDKHFPSYFLPGLTNVAPGSALRGESALIGPTIGLALELRTQLAILVLKRESTEPDYDPQFSIREVFYEREDDEFTSTLRGWDVPGLQAEHCSDERRAQIEAHVEKMLALVADSGLGLDILESQFPWESVVLQLLAWARMRHRELKAMIASIGGIESINDIVMGKTEPSSSAPDPASRRSPLRSRASWTKEQRRRSGGLSLGGASKDDIWGLLISRIKGDQQSGARGTELNPSGEVRAHGGARNEGGKIQSSGTDAEQTLVNDHEVLTEPEPLRPIADDNDLVQNGDEAEEEIRESIEGEGAQSAGEGPSMRPTSSGPPQTRPEFVKLIKQTQNKGKENQGDIFARQATAQRIEFGDGFDGEASQPTPERRQRMERVPVQRRNRRLFEEEDADEDEGFETRQDDGRAAERRQQAPVAKKVRLEPPSSGALPSHQPPVTSPGQQEDSISETEAPEMTEEAPAPTYSDVQALARRNARAVRQHEGQKRRDWTGREVAAFEEYMARFPRKYASILEYDRTEGHKVLQHRTQLNLKDKARNMAMNFIKSGTGLPSGFEDVISPTSKQGLELLAAGFQW
ncbi:uncharacterized protein EI97DRAFT_444433 [Westerdykella ornata]|uniref:Myb-like domain-containing protein n=1 Tax=Westerdykella ornata TaxID=318751 RepID=A0A6A6JD40_WESOR|nr:uncharacterized protein EI97DRAFT_444433 [Westerdykella ornata]KAF2274154.1 hypothetical protein EI97DRAFT_444433 [Westerdykella ornata]